MDRSAVKSFQKGHVTKFLYFTSSSTEFKELGSCLALHFVTGNLVEKFVKYLKLFEVIFEKQLGSVVTWSLFALSIE